MSILLDRFNATLDTLRTQACLRITPHSTAAQGLVNLSSNDYLGISHDQALIDDFLTGLDREDRLMTSASSRLLTGSSRPTERLEARLATLYGTEAALAFDSGYHANAGILPAVVTDKTLILADKLIHASLIDGIRLSKGTFRRYRHNDLVHLEHMLSEAVGHFDDIIIVTESIFSMDGDKVDLTALVALKKRYPNTAIYLDEAHSVGVIGERGLGCAHTLGLTHDIDFLVGTLGKGMASHGAYIVGTNVLRDYLVNTVRPFIFTTALPPIQYAWTDYLLSHMADFQPRRERLAQYATLLHQAIRDRGQPCPSESQIVPLIIGSSEAAINAAKTFQEQGFYVMPVRPPTVPQNTARLRFSLTANLTETSIEKLTQILRDSSYLKI